MEQTNVFDEKAFWEVYDQYILAPTEEFRRKLIPMIAVHSEIRKLERPEKGWKRILAWELLKPVTLYAENGGSHTFLPCGDIIIEQHHWDRDVYITHMPKEEFVSGGVLGNTQRFNGILVGAFLPLYSAETIEQKIIKMFDESKKDALAFLESEKAYWPPQTKGPLPYFKRASTFLWKFF